MSCPSEHYPEGFSCYDLAVEEGRREERAYIVYWLLHRTQIPPTDELAKAIQENEHIRFMACLSREEWRKVRDEWVEKVR